MSANDAHISKVLDPLRALADIDLTPLTNLPAQIPANLNVGNLPQTLATDIAGQLSTLLNLLSTLSAVLVDPLVDYGLAVGGFFTSIIAFILALVITDKYRRWTIIHALVICMIVFAAVGYGIFTSSLFTLLIGQNQGVLVTVQSFSVFNAFARFFSDAALVWRVKLTMENNAWVNQRDSRKTKTRFLWMAIAVWSLITLAMHLGGLLAYNIDNVSAQSIYFLLPVLNSNPNGFARVYPWFIMLTDLGFLGLFSYHAWIEIKGMKNRDAVQIPPGQCANCWVKHPEALRRGALFSVVLAELNLIPFILDTILAVVYISGYNFNQYAIIMVLICLIFTLPATLWSHLLKRSYLWKQYYGNTATPVAGQESQMVQAATPYSSVVEAKTDISSGTMGRMNIANRGAPAGLAGSEPVEAIPVVPYEGADGYKEVPLENH